jgi:hypothetical protein
VLASTEINGFGFSGFELYRGEFTSLVAAIAQGLIGALAASTPEVAFAGLNLHGVGALLGYGWF